MSKTKFHNFDSTILNPDPQRSYVNSDGSIAVIPYAGTRKYCIIINGVITESARNWTSALNKIQKYQKQIKRTKKKLAQSTSNPLSDLLN